MQCRNDLSRALRPGDGDRSKRVSRGWRGWQRMMWSNCANVSRVNIPFRVPKWERWHWWRWVSSRHVIPRRNLAACVRLSRPKCFRGVRSAGTENASGRVQIAAWMKHGGMWFRERQAETTQIRGITGERRYRCGSNLTCVCSPSRYFTQASSPDYGGF